MAESDLVVLPLAEGTTPARLAHALLARGHRRVTLLDARAGCPAQRGALGPLSASFVACDPDGTSRELDPWTPEDLRGATGVAAHAPRWVGVLPYEAFRQLERPAWAPAEHRAAPLVEAVEWARFAAVARFGGDDAPLAVPCAIGERRAAAALVEASRDTLLEEGVFHLPHDLAIEVAEPDPAHAHAARVERALELLRAGDLYQVNLARRLELRLSREPSGLDAQAVVDLLARRAPAAFGALLELSGGQWVLSTSPELLLDATTHDDGHASFDRLVTEPIKGSRPRGASAEADVVAMAELDADPKERAELAMIVDVERNDLGRVARTGSVTVAREPTVVTHPTIHHRVARVEAVARANATRAEVLASMVPSGSVTGAPKVRAMEVIASLEADRRGLYTGGIGYVARNGRVVLSMAIRTAVLAGRRGEYFTGGGIVVRSDPAREVEETAWKAAQLAALVNRRGA